MSDQLQLKRMLASEVSAVVPLFLEESQTRYWEDGKSHDRESAAEMLSRYFQLPSYHWMMFWSADVVGYGHLLRSDFLEAWIVSYIVSPKFQMKGIATAFVKEAKSFALDEGIESLYASVHLENLASVRVVEKSGFKPTEESANSKERLYQWPAQTGVANRDSVSSSNDEL